MSGGYSSTSSRPTSRTSTVFLTSDQTSKTLGEIVKTEWDRVWGEQYLVRVKDPEQGYEYFWMDGREIHPR